MDKIDYLLNSLSKSKFRNSFHLKEKDINYVKEKGIDTIKEHIVLSNLDKKSLIEIETVISSYMMEEKLKYKNKDNIVEE